VQLQKHGKSLKRMVESTECQEYFNNPENRTSEMVHFLDLYGRKFRYMNMDNTNMSSTQIMEQLSRGVGELDEYMEEDPLMFL